MILREACFTGITTARRKLEKLVATRPPAYRLPYIFELAWEPGRLWSSNPPYIDRVYKALSLRFPSSNFPPLVVYEKKFEKRRTRIHFLHRFSSIEAEETFFCRAKRRVNRWVDESVIERGNRNEETRISIASRLWFIRRLNRIIGTNWRFYRTRMNEYFMSSCRCVVATIFHVCSANSNEMKEERIRREIYRIRVTVDLYCSESGKRNPNRGRTFTERVSHRAESRIKLSWQRNTDVWPRFFHEFG